MGRAHRIVLTEPPDRVAAFFRHKPELLDDKSEGGMTPLMTCLDAGRSETARLLLRLGADVNLTDRHGNTALMYAARHGLAEVTALLLQATANVNAADTVGGFTALDWAILGKHDDVVAILRRAGGLARNSDETSGFPPSNSE